MKYELREAIWGLALAKGFSSVCRAECVALKFAETDEDRRGIQQMAKAQYFLLHASEEERRQDRPWTHYWSKSP
jgi:hypothetical protein